MSGVFIMNMRMLIDARHREETRVAVVKGNRIEEFDFESAEHKQLKGNIYLAKVTRVEPSLQAAFVDYGGNRHGFLAFSEIHPDYYQIPREDREALLREEAEHAAQEAALRDQEDYDDDDAAEPAASEEEEHVEGEGEDGETAEGGPRPSSRRRKGHHGDDHNDELRRNRMALRRRYKIQDVIKRRQVLLIQVVKEERGNKGAALTTYLSLAGRYCVLMPNTSHGGGISRKISNSADRKRLKSIIADMNLPATMGCIVRTAGLERTRTEIKRDFDYLARLWDEIREKTLKSSAPALIHNDSDLIKRAIRDIYNRDIDEVVVEGDEGYRQAKDFMKLLMPSHARKVKQYADPVSLFQRHGVEDQLAAMYHPVVQLKSGGYIVINPTEALVSIDINSGRSTREHNIEQTATNDQPGGRAGNRAPVAPARHGGPRRHRLYRHGARLQCPQGREGDEGSAQGRPRAHPGGPHLQLRPDGNEPPAPAHRRARSLDPRLPALRGHGPCAHRKLGRAFGAAYAGGRSRARPGQRHHAARQPRSGVLCAQQQASRTGRDRAALRRFDRHPARWRGRGRAHVGRGQRPPPHRADQLRASGGR
jgi:Rne/Rng family ribonuclease